jgi:hypothetical protein
LKWRVKVLTAMCACYELDLQKLRSECGLPDEPQQQPH